jgi:hypothetical protein
MPTDFLDTQLAAYLSLREALGFHMRAGGCQAKCVTFFIPAPALRTESQTD